MKHETGWTRGRTVRPRSSDFDYSIFLWGAIIVLAFTLMIAILQSIGIPEIPDDVITF
jgi:hypothetical protein